MKHTVKRKDVIWGYISQFLNIASSLLLLPFVLIYLSKEELGLWYVFTAMAGLIQLLEFGLLPTVSRFVSYVYSGATNIKYNEIPECKHGIVDNSLLNSVFYSAKKIYSRISLLSLIAILIGGNYYLSTLNGNYNLKWIMICWSLYGLSITIQLYFGYYNSLLKGRGDQTELNKIIVVTKLIFLIVGIPLLILGYGIISLAIAAFVSVIIDRVMVRRAIFTVEHSYDKKNAPMSTCNEITSHIWKSARDMGLVQLGNYFTVRAGVLVVSSFVGLDAAASYGLTVQITIVIVIVASMLFGLNLPRLNAEQALGNKKTIVDIVVKSLSIANGIYILSAIFLILFGNYFLSFFTKHTQLLETYLLILYLITAMFEMNYSICASYLTTKNKVVFLKSMLISGVSIFLLSLCSSAIFKCGVLGVIASQLFVQMAYNNWKWPLEVYRDLKNAN